MEIDFDALASIYEEEYLSKLFNEETVHSNFVYKNYKKRSSWFKFDYKWRSKQMEQEIK